MRLARDGFDLGVLQSGFVLVLQGVIMACVLQGTVLTPRFCKVE